MNKILFLGCNKDQLPYLKQLKLMNFQVYGTDKNKNAVGKKLCHKFYKVDYENIDELIKIGNNNGFNNKDHVFSASSQFSLVSASKFAKKFKINFPPTKSIKITLDIYKFYNFFAKNNIPIPNTHFINSKKKLIQIVKNSIFTEYYLKSDHSKNKKYIYQINKENFNIKKYNFIKDRYFLKYYILQEEVLGTTYRFNIYANRINIYNFDTGIKLNKTQKSKIISLGVMKHINKIILKLKFQFLLVKFDIIISNTNQIYFLDIGIDPPYRMNKESKIKKINFAYHYLNQYIYNRITCPIILD